MKKSHIYSLFGMLLLFVLSIACERPDRIDSRPPEVIGHYSPEEIATLKQYLNLPEQPFPYAFTLPKHLNGRDTEIDVATATLGRVLFYDKELSLDRSVSCASCHHQSLGFADDKAFSEGIQNKETLRNSIALGSFPSISATYGSNGGTGQSFLFWDGRVHSFRQQMEETFANPNEMGMNMEQVKERVEAQPYYEILFTKAFSNSKVTSDRILEALETFMRSIHSKDSKFDRAIQNAGIVNRSDFTQYLNYLSAVENQGKDLFFEHCSSCHRSSLATRFNDAAEFVNTGLDLDYADAGLGNHSGGDKSQDRFKVPSLRNVELTAPYMHDGRFASLEEVVDFYSTDIQQHPNLDLRLRASLTSEEPKRFNFSEEEKTALVSFLKTLTDYSMAEEEKFSDPFFN